MSCVIENLRLAELVILVRGNRVYYDEFVNYLNSIGYKSVHSFVNEADNNKAMHTIKVYFEREFKTNLCDGIGRPFKKDIAKWYFMAWLFRDAPAQRLAPLLSEVRADTILEKRTKLLNIIRSHAAKIFPDHEAWSWTAIAEVMLARLEGSRRALKGGLFETVVRSILEEFFQREGIKLRVENKEIKLNEETYDVQVSGAKGIILIPVKTRETMGGGHAKLFTRDIHKSISVANKNGYKCIPIIIAESWSVDDIKKLPCNDYIYIHANPNQLQEVKELLRKKVEDLLHVFKKLN